MPPRRCRCRDDSWNRTQLRSNLLRVATVLDEDVQGLHDTGADAGRSELVAGGDRGSCPGEVLQLRLVGVQLRPEAREHGNDRETDCSNRDRTAEHEARPPSPGAVLRMAV